MTNWIQIKANSNLIQNSTEKAVLIKLPKSELMFWHPAKCVRTNGKSNYLMTISFTKDFKFKCFRNGKGKTTSFTKIEEVEYSAKEIQELFA
jgi:hypothetical protein